MSKGQGKLLLRPPAKYGKSQARQHGESLAQVFLKILAYASICKESLNVRALVAVVENLPTGIPSRDSHLIDSSDTTLKTILGAGLDTGKTRI
ncbi:hypothetical protein [Undibacterium sp. TC9W]|uniref:hypothetical protein n=1 Tax=Undibacterium sp. TC9W TaxID=3413053 RepID=UPI003BF42BC0